MTHLLLVPRTETCCQSSESAIDSCEVYQNDVYQSEVYQSEVHQSKIYQNEEAKFTAQLELRLPSTLDSTAIPHCLMCVEEQHALHNNISSLLLRAL
ncbi:hypothetical protein EB796_025023 [Bugula neritina]|uniref:Uncharacterized protein n=1 Tax=Bugula neritina TaxID=10212 RepID=A0A7J7IRV6_BUGNE|nr:hypothetical protein EB796_025023 [Bugula neritina]